MTSLESWRRDRTPVWVGRILTAAAVWAVLAFPLRHNAPHLYRWCWTLFDLINLPANPSLFNCAWLMVVSYAIRHRKRVALWAVVVVTQAPAVVYAATLAVLAALGQNWRGWLNPALRVMPEPWGAPLRAGLAAAVALGLTWWLWSHRRAFSGPISRQAAIRAVLTLAAGITVAWAWAFTWALTLGSHSVPTLRKAWWALNVALGQGPEEIVAGVRIAGHRLWHSDWVVSIGPIWWVVRSTSLLATLGLLVALVVFTRSDKHLATITAEQELALRRLLVLHGSQDSLGYFNLRRDKSVVFSADGRAAVVGRLVGATLLASGDPVGDRAAWADAIGRWVDLARRRGWTPAALSVTPRGARAYEAAGLRSLALGDEAVIQTDSFSLRDPRLKEVAEAARRARKAGYTVQIRRQEEIEANQMAVLVRDAEYWRRGGDERGFSMTSGRLGDPSDGRTLIVTAHDASGAARALLTFVPWGRRGASLDIMRHDPRAH
ncbi:MAG: phosphatidylglycerol lysyltransferase domain-containing protein, partial [Bifidobacteriaceae bacterium]|nr:phosphatidylglycerol lysyltransferase domain-containing protein [Bifidobacteriaceae bacterium]